MTRRDWMLSTAALPAAAARGAQSNPRNIVVSSGNGARAGARAMELIKAGADTLDAVIAGVNINEEDPEDTSVGYGGLPNEEGVVEARRLRDARADAARRIGRFDSRHQ